MGAIESASDASRSSSMVSAALVPSISVAENGVQTTK